MKLLASLVNLEQKTKRASDLDEGLAKDLKRMFAGKTAKVRAEMLPLTKEQRDFIKKNFTSSNVDIKWSPEGEYVLTHNAKANQGSGSIHFRNEDGKLKASVSYFRNKSDVSNPKKSPLISADEKVETSADIKKLKDMLGESVFSDDNDEHAWGPLDEGVADKIKSFAKGILTPKKKYSASVPMDEVDYKLISSEVPVLTKKKGGYSFLAHTGGFQGIPSVYFAFTKDSDGVYHVEIEGVSQTMSSSFPMERLPRSYVEASFKNAAELGKLMKKYDLKAKLGEASTAKSNAAHEIEWLKTKIAGLEKQLEKKPSVAKEIKDLNRQIKERELAIAFTESVETFIESSTADSITDFKDRQAFIGLKKQATDKFAKAKMSKDLVKLGHLKMAKQFSDEGDAILAKYSKLKEAITYTDIEDWKQAVKNSYPQQARRISFLSRMEGSKMTVSAEIKGEDRCYGVWDQESDKGVVLSEAESTTWSKTKKVGTHLKTDEPTYEWQELDSNGRATGNREWRNAAGKCMDRKHVSEDKKLPAGITLKAMKDDYGTIRVMKAGKVLGMIWQDDVGSSNDWCAEVSQSGNSWDGIDSKDDAIDSILDELELSEAMIHGMKSRDGSKSAFKAAELGQELGHEKNEPEKFNIKIDGKIWKKDGQPVSFSTYPNARKASISPAFANKKIEIVPQGYVPAKAETKSADSMKFGIEIEDKLWKKDGKAVSFPSKEAASKVALSGSLKFKKTTVVPLKEGVGVFKLGSKVIIFKGPADAKGKVGTIAEINTKFGKDHSYVVDWYDEGPKGARHSITLSKSDMRMKNDK
jgi:hypothetical protein